MHFLAVVNQRTADRDQLLTHLESAGHFDGVAESLPDLDRLRLCIGFTATFAKQHHREPRGIRGRPDYRTQRDDDSRRRALTRAERQGSNHPGANLLAWIVQRHFNGEYTALRIGLRRDRRDNTGRGVLERVQNNGLRCPRWIFGRVVSGTADTAFTTCVSIMLNPTTAFPTMLPRSTFRAVIHPAKGARNEVSLSDRFASLTAARAFAAPASAPFTAASAAFTAASAAFTAAADESYCPLA